MPVQLEPLQTTGGKYRRDSRRGLRTVTRVFDDLASEVQCDSFIDPSPPLGLVEVSREGDQFDDGKWKLSIFYEGAASGVEFGETWSMDFATDQSPVQAFRGWEKFKAKFGATFDEDGQLKGFPAKIKIGGQLVNNPAYGLTDFLDARAILKVRIVAAQTDDSWFENLGKIDVPKPKKFRLPVLRDGRNWLKAGVQSQERGNAVEAEIAWKLSGEGGWLSDLYLPR